jgi:hypothetical protein
VPAAANGDESAIGPRSVSRSNETNKRVLNAALGEGAAGDCTRVCTAGVLVDSAENIPLYTFTFGKPGGATADLSLDDWSRMDHLHRCADRGRATLTASGYANQRAKVQLLWETEGNGSGGCGVDTGGRWRGAGRFITRRGSGEYG